MTQPATVSPAQRSPAPQRNLIGAVIVLAVATVIAAAFLAVVLFVGKTMTVQGAVVLTEADIAQTPLVEACKGKGGAADIAEGAGVTVTGADGKVLAVGRLQAGEWTRDSHGSTVCTLAFVITDVPADAGPYGLQVAHHDPEPVTESEIRQQVTLQF